MTAERVDFSDTAGKTVLKVFGELSDRVLMVFTDNTYCIFYAYELVGDVDPVIENGDLRPVDWQDDLEELLALGVVPQHMFDKWKDRQSRFKEQERLARREQFELLKKEFEPTRQQPNGE